jgi:hypothetical protein
MRLILLAVLTAVLSINSFAQKEIKIEEVKDHVGDSVKVTGMVSGIRYLEGAKNSPTFVNVGGVYPNQLLTIVVWGNVRKDFKIDLSDKKYTQCKAQIAGKIELYKDKPQIVITDPSQLVFVCDQ